MKQIIIFVLSLLFISSTLDVNAYNNDPNSFFTVQIGSFTNPKAKDFKMLKSVGAIYLEHPKSSKLKRVLLGRYKEKADATAALAKVKATGFQDAFLAARPIKQSNKVWIVQLAAYNWGESINLNEWKTDDKLFVQLIDDKIKLMSGTYPDFKVASKKLAALRSSGYTNAFMDEVHPGWLLAPSDFETSYIHLNLDPSHFGTKKGGEPIAGTIDGKVKEGSLYPGGKKEVTPPGNKKLTPPNIKNIPTEYVNNIGSRSDNKNLASLNKVKRNSVLELQKVLKSEKSYVGSLDGLNGNGTARGIDGFAKSNERYQRYAALTKDAPVENQQKGGINSIEYNVDLIEVNPNMAASNLRDFDNPVADVFLAYLYLTEKVKINNASVEINDLMNGAINRAYKGFKGKARFDHEANYSYKETTQLLQHLAYIYEATTDAPAIPCWMFKEHNVELTAAFVGLKAPAVAECGGFTEWKEVRMLVAMAEDLDPQPEEAKQKSASAEKQAYITKRTELFMTPRKPSTAEIEILESWNTNLWTALDKWSTTDPLHQKMMTPFKVAYYNAYDKFENHYARKGFSSEESKGLALMSLRSFVNYHLNSYMKR